MSTGSGQRRRAPAAALAPGFRFHPTDEELVGYYLKRKITGKTFRVDAISDVDLYKSEPWDLPGKSRIQSRDMEWYFFSALDKKYANRSRTNRATGSGYWKTTGKDRAVLCGGRHAGMKKTLVFHIGRAPKGERTNWVMHEYRLEDEDLSNSKIPQDAFVVCRVFQKKGPGPQNGAQYGAPLVEEEWEREDEETVIEQDDGDVSFNVINDDPLLADVDEFDKDWSAQDQAALPDFNTLIEIGDIPDDIDNDVKDLSQDLSILNDEFLELNDFVSSLVDPSTTHLDEALATLPNRNMFNPVEEESPGFSEFLLLDQSPDRSNFLEVNDILGSEPAQQIPSTLEVNADEDSTFFDASNIHFLDSLASSSSSPDLVDELIAYFDATENVDFESVSVDSNALRVNHVDLQPRREPQKNPETSQPRIMGFVDKLDTSISKGGFSGRLVSMLGSISSPPALAAEKNPNTNPIRIAPAMIQRDVDFFLSYTGGVDSEKIPKIEGGFLAFVQRNSFHLLFLSVLLLAASFKICVCVYSH